MTSLWPDITKIQISNVTNATTVNQLRAKRMFDGALVQLTASSQVISFAQLYFGLATKQSNGWGGYSASKDTPYIVNGCFPLLAESSGANVQFEDIFIVSFIDDVNFQLKRSSDPSFVLTHAQFPGSNIWLDVWSAQNANLDNRANLSFRFDGNTGKIIGIIATAPRYAGNTDVFISGTSTQSAGAFGGTAQSPAGFMGMTNTPMVTSDSNDFGHDNTAANRIYFVISTPSAYMAALANISSIKCCAGENGPSYTDTANLQICSDQALNGYNSEGCFNLMAVECKKDMNLDQGQCLAYCSYTNTGASAECDNWLTEYCAAQADPVNNPLCPCYMPSTFYQKFFASLQAKLSLPTGVPTLPRCYYPPCATQLTNLTASVKGINVCADVQNCLQIATINNDGTINAKDISVNMANSGCNAQFGGGSGGGGTTSTSTAVNYPLVLSIAAAAFVILIAVIILTRKK
jgi:hypothetical protein